MNRTAYFTTDIAIKTLSKLLKARTVFHGLGNMPDGPIIFVINHFTRLETLLLPYYLYHLTKTPIWSLASDGLFNKGALKAYLDKVGVVSTKDPQRDKLIIKTLLTGKAHWIIFPEGRMVKTKKLVSNGEYVIGDDHSARAPHTGAASLALRAEIFRHFLQRDGREDDGRELLAAFLDIAVDEHIAEQSVKIVPVNLTYYPLRAHDNILSGLASRYVKDPSERMLEELMTEGTMLLEGVDIDMQFGGALDTVDELHTPSVRALLSGPVVTGFRNNEQIMHFLQKTAGTMMQTYMDRIYSATTINHDHLFASLLRRRSFRPFTSRQFIRPVYLVSDYLQARHDLKNNLHSALTEDQLHLLVDDRYEKYKGFVDLALTTGSLVKEHQTLRKQSSYWKHPPLFHKARVFNPIEVMANEIEPLGMVQKYIRLSSLLPDCILRLIIARRLFQKDQKAYQVERHKGGELVEFESRIGSPFVLPSFTNRLGVVLVHSYLSAPEEMRQCGALFRKQGAWVYGVRLPGHGTNPESLATKKWEEWRDAVERGYVLMDSLCRNVILVGFSAGGSLVLELASRLETLTGVVAICPPYVLQDYSKRFMPPMHIWNRLLARWKGNSMSEEFVEFEPEIKEVNYSRNPVAGVIEVGKLLGSCRAQLSNQHHRTLVISTDQDQVVGGSCSQELFSQLGSKEKEHLIISSPRHNIIYGPEGARARAVISSFIRDCLE
mgnify:CR=1 FL=1